MSNLTTEQEHAMSVLKGNLHLPDGGFHRLILQLCIEFQLPFQKVRTVLKTSQSAIEYDVINKFDSINEATLSKENWLSIIKQTLTVLAKENRPIMENLTNNPHYIKATNAIKQPIFNINERDVIYAELSDAYEAEVYKPLAAMLYTSDLYWHLSDELVEMTEVRCQQFIDYVQHVDAIAHLTALYKKVESRQLATK